MWPDSFVDDSVISQCQKVWHTGGLFLPSAGAFTWVCGTLCGVFIPTPLSPLQSPPLLESLGCPKPPPSASHSLSPSHDIHSHNLSHHHGRPTSQHVLPASPEGLQPLLPSDTLKDPVIPSTHF